jgi:hypothetical protein
MALATWAAEYSETVAQARQAYDRERSDSQH